MGNTTEHDPLGVFEQAEQFFSKDIEWPAYDKTSLGLKLLGIGVGIGCVGAGLYAGWFVAGIIAIKLGLLSFWWHLLSWAVVGGFIAAPFIKLANWCFGI